MQSHAGGGAQARACAAAPAWGAPPGNTAPQKYRAHALRALKVLPGAVDSLYVSYSGTLFSSVAEELDDRKRLARCPEDEAKALAQYWVGPHLLSVSDKGRRRAEFVLRNSRFSLDVARGSHVPLAYVQIASSFLAQVGVQAALGAVRFVVNSLGAVCGDETLSRIDLCVDFVPSQPLDRWPDDLWVTRASRIDTHAVRGRFTGWSFGLGAGLSARLYDKRFEVETVSEKVYMYGLWESAGVAATDPVWRLEFQLVRPVLKELGIRTVADATSRLADLWSYCCTKWLSLRVPAADRNRARWPLAQLWTDWTAAGSVDTTLS
ncbi:hypothetical protein [Metallibacterium sp.]|uniref:hypothetical protein n=1 Tax=Metallibacterium sp. TaxID=2940281 RepID=UPI0026283D8B|nr:hypothetical protein [Metallibacterium sp.]